MDIIRKIDTIIIHCSATPNGRWNTVEDIDAWHRERGFHRNHRMIGHNQPRLTSIGYHFVIYTTGAVTIGRGINEIGAHAAGHNARSIGVCMLGTDKFSPEQWSGLAANIAGLQSRIPGVRVIGHRDVNAHKECPGFDVQEWLRGGMAALDGHLYDDFALLRKAGEGGTY